MAKICQAALLGSCSLPLPDVLPAHTSPSHNAISHHAPSELSNIQRSTWTAEKMGSLLVLCSGAHRPVLWHVCNNWLPPWPSPRSCGTQSSELDCSFVLYSPIHFLIAIFSNQLLISPVQIIRTMLLHIFWIYFVFAVFAERLYTVLQVLADRKKSENKKYTEWKCNFLGNLFEKFENS